MKYISMPMDKDCLDALQAAIRHGAFASQIMLLRSMIDKTEGRQADELMQQVGNLDHAVRCLMEARQVNEAALTFAKNVQTLISKEGYFKTFWDEKTDAQKLETIINWAKGVDTRFDC